MKLTKKDIPLAFAGAVDLVVWLGIIIGAVSGLGFEYGLILQLFCVLVALIFAGLIGTVFLVLRVFMLLADWRSH